MEETDRERAAELYLITLFCCVLLYYVIIRLHLTYSEPGHPVPARQVRSHFRVAKTT